MEEPLVSKRSKGPLGSHQSRQRPPKLRKCHFKNEATPKPKTHCPHNQMHRQFLPSARPVLGPTPHASGFLRGENTFPRDSLLSGVLEDYVPYKGPPQGFHGKVDRRVSGNSSCLVDFEGGPSKKEKGSNLLKGWVLHICEGYYG